MLANVLRMVFAVTAGYDNLIRLVLFLSTGVVRGKKI